MGVHHQRASPITEAHHADSRLGSWDMSSCAQPCTTPAQRHFLFLVDMQRLCQQYSVARPDLMCNIQAAHGIQHRARCNRLDGISRRVCPTLQYRHSQIWCS